MGMGAMLGWYMLVKSCDASHASSFMRVGGVAFTRVGANSEDSSSLQTRHSMSLQTH